MLLRRAANAFPFGRGHEVGPGENDKVRAPEGPNRFSQKSTGKQSPATEGIQGINQDDVEVAGKPPVLESVVEDQNLGVELLDRDSREHHAIRSGQVRTVGQIVLEHQGLVVRSSLRAIASASDRHA
jgi:hypothetical protein